MGKIFKALEKSKGIDMGTSIVVEENRGSDDLQDTVVEENNGDDDLQDTVVEENRGSDDLQNAVFEEHVGDDDLPMTGESVYKKLQNNESFQNLDKSLITYLKPHSFEAEQFRLLKTAILFPHSGTPPRTIMVTSTAPGEGKSFVASNIAISIAQSIDEYVLLMDCDLRLPSLHTRFGFSFLPGLSEYLRTEKSLASIIHKTAIDKLSLLPAGKPPANPTELISSDQMRRLLHEVKGRYQDRYIIIDSPPPYLTSEASALARQVDGIVIVVKTRKTKRSDLQDLIDTYGKEKILGVVKNFSNQRRGFKKYEYK